MSEYVFILHSRLIVCLGVSNSRLEMIFLPNFEGFFYYLLASNAAVEKSKAILIPNSLNVTCFSFSH